MIEQTGSIFLNVSMDFHCSILSDILIRNENMEVVNKHKKRFLYNVYTLIPTSYPGNSIITEDIGEIFGEDDCVVKD